MRPADCVEFAVNAAGVRHDAYRFNDYEVDPSWDAVWDAKVHRDHDGWSAELRIPFSQLRFALGERMRFGFNAYREVGRTREVQYWRLLSKNVRSVVSLFGDLAGLEGIERRNPVEVTPYVAARSSDGDGSGASMLIGGLDARVVLPLGVALTAAVNPDFGQVEVDPAIVNLSSVETFFPERRPFFVEGADLFRLTLNPDTMTAEALLYTRRIGRLPQLATSDDLLGAGATDPTNILGALKVVNRSESGWTFGSLAAITARETAVRRSAGAGSTVTTEPFTAYGAVRVGRDFQDGRTQLAGFVTSVARDLPADATTLRSSAHAAGLTVSIRPTGRIHIATCIERGKRSTRVTRGDRSHAAIFRSLLPAPRYRVRRARSHTHLVRRRGGVVRSRP